MKKYLQAKKKNHYVWRKYLQNWTVEGNVYYLTKKNKISKDSPTGMCREEGFYKISTLNKNDLAYINSWVKKCPDHLQEFHNKTISKFLYASNVLKIIEEEKEKSEFLEMAENAIRHNCLEDMYCGVERGAEKSIEGLSVGNISVINDIKNAIGLYSYLGHQIMRTKAIKERFFSASSSNNEFYRDLTEKNWWLVSYILGTNIGWSLYESRNRDNLSLVKSPQDYAFITGDCPVINIHPEVDAIVGGNPVESLDLYFPVSPKYALIICESEKWRNLSGDIEKNIVASLNRRIASNAKYSIFSNTEELVRENRKEVGSW
ncbi:DUF4238 domain-containing protein [Iodobacter fluviatilis]|uniref:Uncharacterized protein DUF4238 n=1 Tax=Iodobacter fluviatilis TaxID=537 RepID=A0A377QB85_9NEIS|nr:DUF4238 domain-containing protein [Iodobacter fluviatilis]TCU88797.1 uncharacterized protein DUF4238 [Iodobacter fluviatilis]STQ91131.1 Uncharacterised protein [Iodobacter fluviatilis]